MLSSEQMRSIFIRKQRELEQYVKQWNAQMAKVEARIRQIEQEGKPSAYDVIVKSVHAQSMLSMRACVPSVSDMASYRCRMFTSLYDHAASLGIADEVHMTCLPEAPASASTIKTIIPLAVRFGSCICSAGRMITMYMARF